MIYLLWLAVGLILCFGLVILVGAPYLPTLNPQILTALKLLNLKPGQTLLELGSGDGRMLKAAAQQGIKAVGIELNPLLVIYSRIYLWKYRKLISIKWGSFWASPLPAADGIYVFLHNRFMKKLDKKIVTEIQSPISLVSFAFEIPGKKPDKSENGLYLYNYKPLASKRSFK